MCRKQGLKQTKQNSWSPQGWHNPPAASKHTIFRQRSKVTTIAIALQSHHSSIISYIASAVIPLADDMQRLPLLKKQH